MYDRLKTLLKRIDPQPVPGEEMHAATRRLQDARLIPRRISTHMHTIRIHRNLAVKEQQRFDGADATAVLAAWYAITEWAQSAGHRIDGPP
jgi:hypothetical protein